MSGRRRVALFLYDLARSGVVANTVRLADALAAGGHEVHLLLCRAAGRDEQVLDPRIAVTVLRSGRGGGGRATGLIRAVPALRRALRRLRPDVLVSAGNHGHLAALAASRGTGAELVLRISNAPDHPGDARWLRAARKALLTLLARSADRLLLVSARLAEHPALARALAAGRATIVPNGVPVAAIRERAAAPLADPAMRGADPVVVTVGRLVRQKNLPALIEAMALVNRTRPARLLIVGRGDPAALAAQAAALGIGDRVGFTGELANPLPLVAAADVFVLPSLWEGRSNALLEAMALDVPIVASRTAGDAPELLGEGAHGLLIDPHDPAALADAILRQLRDPLRPGDRAAAYDLTQAVARAAAAVLGERP